MSASDASDDEHLKAALSRLCAEAHTHSLGPETMLVAVKRAWSGLCLSHKHFDGDPKRETVAFERVLSACLTRTTIPHG